MKITVLGGAGKMGCISVQDLANDNRVDEVVIADVDVKQAQTVADYLKSPKVHNAFFLTALQPRTAPGCR